MYKVDKYKYISKTTNDFIYGNVYYLRTTKRGTHKYLTSENKEIQVNNEKISLISDYNKRFLENNFIYEGFSLYNNHKDFKTLYSKL